MAGAAQDSRDSGAAHTMLIGAGGRAYTWPMAFLDAHLGTLLVAICALAMVLGIVASALAMRLMLALDNAANDPVYRRSHRTRVRRDPGARARLHLAA